MKVNGKPIILGGGKTAIINVTYHKGATLTCANGNTVYTAPDNNGFASFSISKLGTWVLTIVKDEYRRTMNVKITSKEQVENIIFDFANVYGVCRDDTSAHPRWIHTDMAVGKSAGYVGGVSDFDNVSPWKEIQRVIFFDTKDIMVKIPLFYYKRYRDNGIEYIKIADNKYPDFEPHPAFVDDNGNIVANIYVGAYSTSANNKSESGASIRNSMTRSEARGYARAKGTGWGVLDIHADSAIQMLMLVEFADYDIQFRLGAGYTLSTNTDIIKTGTCDAVPNLTGNASGTGDDGKSDVVWRGIEGYWGNALEFLEGLNVWRDAYYIGPKRSTYADGNQSHYIQLTDVRFDQSKQSGTIAGHGLSSICPHLFLPSGYVSDDDKQGTTHVTDGAWWVFDGWKVVLRGGCYKDGSLAGPFAMNVTYTATSELWFAGYRLMYMPDDEYI